MALRLASQLVSTLPPQVGLAGFGWLAGWLLCFSAGFRLGFRVDFAFGFHLLGFRLDFGWILLWFDLDLV